MTQNPYLNALDLVQINHGTSGQYALAKCILSLYNSNHSFGMGEVLGALDRRYSTVALSIVSEYASHGETAELRLAGEYVYDRFPDLIEMSNAMGRARSDTRRKWERQREKENRRLYPEEYR